MGAAAYNSTARVTVNSTTPGIEPITVSFIYAQYISH